MAPRMILVSLLVAAFPQLALSELLIFENTTGIDWYTTPVDIRLAAEDQPGDNGLMGYDETHTWGVQSVGDDHSIAAYFTSSPQEWRASWPLFAPQIDDYVDKAAFYLGGRTHWNRYGAALVAVDEPDGRHNGWIVTNFDEGCQYRCDFLQGRDRIIRWAYETEPGVKVTLEQPLPEPSAVMLCAALVAVVAVWRR